MTYSSSSQLLAEYDRLAGIAVYALTVAQLDRLHWLERELNRLGLA